MKKSTHTAEMNALKLWLKAKREESGLSMRALGESLGKPHSYVQKVEDGERLLDVVEYVWYCRALKIDPHEGLAVVSETL